MRVRSAGSRLRCRSTSAHEPAGPLAGGGQNAIPNPSLFRTDTKKPVLVLESETDVPRHLPARQPDSARYRLWEVAGTAHFDEDGLHALTGIPKEEMVTTPARMRAADQLRAPALRRRHRDARHRALAAGGPAPPKAPLVAIAALPHAPGLCGAFSNATDKVQRDGFLLPADAKDAKSEASRAAVGG